MKKQFSSAIRAAILGILGIGLLLSVNHLSGQISKQFGLRIDMTSQKLYELSNETKDILNNLNDNVQIRVFSSQSDFLPLMKEILEQYQINGNGYITIEYIDPYIHPVLIDSYIQRGYSIELGSIAVESGIFTKVFSLEDMFSIAASNNSVQEIKCEQQLSSAILYVAGGETLSAIFTSGHNETPSDSLKELIVQNNYEVQTLALSMEKLPDDTNLLVIASPTSDFSKEEIRTLDSYMANHGRILAFAGPSSKNLPNLQDFFAEWGMGFSGITVAEELQYTDTNPLSIVPVYSAHPINQYFNGNQLYLSMPSSTSLNALFLSQGGIRTQKLLYSTDKSYDAEHKKDGIKGPFSLALTAEKKQNEQKARIVLIGSNGIYSDSLMHAENYGNSKFLAQTIRWCTETDTALSIVPKTLGNTQIMIPISQVIPLSIFFIAIIPIGILLIGIWNCHQRKHS